MRLCARSCNHHSATVRTVPLPRSVRLYSCQCSNTEHSTDILEQIARGAIIRLWQSKAEVPATMGNAVNFLKLQNETGERARVRITVREEGSSPYESYIEPGHTIEIQVRRTSLTLSLARVQCSWTTRIHLRFRIHSKKF